MRWEELINKNLKDMEIRELMRKYKSLDEVYLNFDKLPVKVKRELERKTEGIVYDKNVRVISYNDEEYPYALREIPDFPCFLYVKGKKLKEYNNVAVVGTRNYTLIGEKSCAKIIKGLSDYKDICIISGMAKGIDSIAHKNALENGLNTIAVLPTSVDKCYPIENIKLKESIIENGSIISEYKKEDSLKKINFVMRNRIIAGLSRAVYIVQSYKSGGSLITAKFASIYDREVYATPSNIFDKSFEGTNELIMHNKAKLIQSADDIAYEYSWRKKK